MVRILDLPEAEIVPCCCPVLAIMGFEDPESLDPFRFLLIAISGWMNHRQLVIDYLREENRVLRE